MKANAQQSSNYTNSADVVAHKLEPNYYMTNRIVQHKIQAFGGISTSSKGED